MSAFHELLIYVNQLSGSGYPVVASVCRRLPERPDWENVIMRTSAIDSLEQDIVLAAGDRKGTDIRVRVFINDGHKRKASRTFYYTIDQDAEVITHSPLDMTKHYPIDEFQKAMSELPATYSLHNDLLNARVEAAELRAEVKRLDIRCDELKAARDKAAAELDAARAEIERLRAAVIELEKEPTGLNGLLANVDPGEAIKSVAELGQSLLGLLRDKQETRRQELAVEAARLQNLERPQQPYEPLRQQYAQPQQPEYRQQQEPLTHNNGDSQNQPEIDYEGID